MCRSSWSVALLLAIIPAAHLVQAADRYQAPLVVGCSEEVTLRLARLVGSEARVEPMFDRLDEAAKYSSDNQRACHIRDNAKLIVVDSQCDTCTQFWMHRLQAQGLTPHFVATEGRASCEERVLVDLHDIIVEHFPAHRQKFDAQLRAEVQRLNRDERSTTWALNP